MPIAILLPADVEGMEVAVIPAHRRLDRLVQVAERHRAGHQQAAPDRRLGAAQRHLQTDDGLAGVALLRGGLGHDLASSASDSATPISGLLREAFGDRKRAMGRAGRACPSRVRRMEWRIGMSASSGGFEDGPDIGVEPGAPFGAEAVGDLAEDDAGPQRLLRAVVGRRNGPVGDEDEQVLAELLDDPLRASVRPRGRRDRSKASSRVSSRAW